MIKEITRDVILVLIVIAGLVSFFWTPETAGENIKFLQTLMGGIIGWYTGIKTLPIVTAFGRKK